MLMPNVDETRVEIFYACKVKKKKCNFSMF